MALKKTLILGLGLLAVLFIGFQLAKPKLVAKAFNKRVAQNVGVDPTADLVDGLHVYICGAGSPLPDPLRSGPCTAVLAGDQAFVFDTGSGSARNLGPIGFPVGRTNAIVLTHLHSDHIDGLGEMLLGTWINGGRTTPTPVFGPKGTAQVVEGFNTAYRIDSTYRTAHHGADIADPNGFGAVATEIKMAGDSVIVWDSGDVKITAFKVSHEPIDPAFGYRIDYKDRSVVISGDTAYDPRIARAAKGVDVLLHEALNPDMVRTLEKGARANNSPRLAKIFFDIQDYHTSPIDAARIANQAGATELVLTHIVPMLPSDALIPTFVKGADAEFSGKITVARDGLILRLPAGSDAILHENGM
jgi:ribonuclease Z